jgi:redox-sensitive bicupin YhaK (pirin superfamily)
MLLLNLVAPLPPLRRCAAREHILTCRITALSHIVAMIRFSAPYTPAAMSRGDVFSARQYSARAFDNLIDPVLNIDWFEMKGPTFPAHPHAGFSAVTYLFADSPNGFLNRDSLGGVHDILPGGLHWSRASSGILHEETPLPGGQPVRGLQIFVNLPESRQSDDAAAFPLAASEVASATGAGWRSRTAMDGVAIGAAAEALPAPVRVQEIVLDRASAFTVDLPQGWGGILIVLEGAAAVDAAALTQAQAIGFSTDAAASFRISTEAHVARLALIAGKQLYQPVYAYGPLMMASAHALEAARARVASLPQIDTLRSE